MEKLIAWVEIPSANFQRAINFYNEVFNLKLEGKAFNGEKMAFFPNNEGALIDAPGYEPSEQGTLVSLNVPDSIDKTVLRIGINGGKIVLSKTNIDAEGNSFFAIFVDTEGNKIGLYERK